MHAKPYHLLAAGGMTAAHLWHEMRIARFAKLRSRQTIFCIDRRSKRNHVLLLGMRYSAAKVAHALDC